MAVIKETVPLDATLKGEGRERTCRVKALRHAIYADECSRPTCFSYSRCDIEDSDDFPDGYYELHFEGRSIPITKRAGQYFPG